MSGNNGRTFGQTLQRLAGRQDVPIVGQPFELNTWLVQILLTCKCEAPKPVLIIGQPGSAAGQCPSCLKIYTLLTIGINPAGQPSFNVAVSAGPAEAAEEK